VGGDCHGPFSKDVFGAPRYVASSSKNVEIPSSLQNNPALLTDGPPFPSSFSLAEKSGPPFPSFMKTDDQILLFFFLGEKLAALSFCQPEDTKQEACHPLFSPPPLSPVEY